MDKDIKKSISATDKDAQYDEKAKNLLGHKIIQKTRKQKKFVKLFFNNTVKKVIVEYLNEFPTDNLDEHMFKSREGDGAIAATTLWRIVKNTAKEAGVNQNIGSHSLRKLRNIHQL